MAEPKVIKTTEEKLSSVEEQIEKKKTEISLGQKRLRDLQKERDKLIKQKDKEYADKLISIFFVFLLNKLIPFFLQISQSFLTERNFCFLFFNLFLYRGKFFFCSFYYFRFCHHILLS